MQDSDPFGNVLSRLKGVHRQGSRATAKCPGHDDKRASLSIKVGRDGKVLLFCHTGCPIDRILDALGLTAAALFVPRKTTNNVIAEYKYTDAAGDVRYVVERHDPKGFIQRRPNGKGGWIWDLKGVSQLPYRLPELLAADLLEPVLIAEGEKDVDVLTKLGFIATTNSGGAGKWRPELSPHLAGRDVVLIPDNDEAGEKHIAIVAESLRGIASSIRILRLPNLQPKGDVSDWLNAGGTADQLRELVAAKALASCAAGTSRRDVRWNAAV